MTLITLNNLFSSVARSTLFLLCSATWLAAASGVQVSHQARALQPGEVVLLRVEGTEKLTSVSAQAFQRTFPLYPTAEDNIWEGLLGLDLEADSGLSTVVISGQQGASRFRQEYPLHIVSKEFAVRNLTVPPQFVDPPAETLERIRLESRKVSALFRKIGTHRHWQGSFQRPVPGVATSSFGRRSVFNGQPRSPHTGADFRASEGTPIAAPNAATVVLAEELYYAGKTVILDHGLGLFSYLAHLSRLDVSEGDQVEKGQVIGLVGATGRVTGAHLHWTLRLAGARVDPVSLLEVLQEPQSSF
jgi:biotin carboxyl carrier protein